MKLCKDCKHFIPATDPAPEALRQWSRCHAIEEQPASRHPVDGSDMRPVFMYADVARTRGKCGIEAKLFEAKP